ncbi:uncharacterized protein LOC108220429 isoform X2 [Daucus carota subsp. sativus]
MSNEKNGTRNVDTGQKYAMRTPTLVARLMGLDSLPAVQRGKIKKISSDRIEVDTGGKFASDCCQFGGQHKKFKPEGSKHELKPHKLQKTGFSERRAVARFGAERLQFKNVLSRSNKHHHPNFVPSVKSPTRLSKRNAARLIGAATRILEPGLQARNRAKSGLPYSSTTDGLLVEAGTGLSKDQVESATYYENVARFSRGKSSCENCGNIVDIPESGTYMEEQPSCQPSILVNGGCPLSGREICTQRLPLSYLGTEKGIENPKKITAFSAQSPGNVKPGAEDNFKRETLHRGSQIRWQPNQRYRKEEIPSSSICYKQKFCVRNLGVTGRDRTSPRCTDTVHLKKDISLNQSTIDHKCSRVPSKLDKCRYASKRRSTDRLYDPLSSARKRRSVDAARQDDIFSSFGSTIERKSKINCNVLSQTMVSGDIQSAKLACISSNLVSLEKINKTSDTNAGVLPFTFNSKKLKDRTLVKTNDGGFPSECTSSCSKNSSVLDKININEQVLFQNSSPFTVDTLGVLEQKLKEIRSLNDNEMALGGAPLRQTPAIILQELISALTAEGSFNVNNVISMPTETGISSCCEHTISAHPHLQVKMQGSSFCVQGNLGFHVGKGRVLGGCDMRNGRKVWDSLCIRKQGGFVSGLRLSVGAQHGGKRSVDSVFRKSGRAKTTKVHATEGEADDVPPKIQMNSSGSVLPYVGVACLGAILFGYHLGVVNGALECLSRDLGIAENAGLQGWIVSSLLAGATVGSFTGGSMADKFGRTKTFQLDAIPLAVGTFLSATAQSVQTMIIGRILAGIGIGISSAIVPLYISEISPTEIRGTLGSVNQICICVGILAALVAGLPLAANPLWWRTMFGIAVIPSVILALGMTFSPESPGWLYQQGKISQAEIAVKRLYGKERVTEVMNNLTTGSQGSSEPEAGWSDLFSNRYWKVVSVGAALFLFQQLAGINAVVYYSTPVFRTAGIASDVAASSLVGASNVFGSTVASSLMDKQGRRSLLITSYAGMAASMFLLSLSFSWKVLAPYSGKVAVVGTVLYVLFFSLGAGPVPALLLPEIFPSRIRAKAVALSWGMHWASNFVIGLSFLSLVTKFGIGKVYLGFACVCLLGLLYITGNVVETKGKSLEEIQHALSSGV